MGMKDCLLNFVDGWDVLKVNIWDLAWGPQITAADLKAGRGKDQRQ